MTMVNNFIDDDEVVRFQKNMSVIRTIAGWSQEYLAMVFSVTRQCIVNLENQKTNMSKIHYVAFRTMLDTVALKNDTLYKAMKVLVDWGASDEDEAEIRAIIRSYIQEKGKRTGIKLVSSDPRLHEYINKIYNFYNGN